MLKSKSEKGQAVFVLLIALSLVLVGAMGLVIDGAHLYDELQLAQVAADAAATAGALSMLQGTNTFGTTAFTCGTTDTKIPCQYARMNGFGGSASDTVTVDFPTCTGTPDPCGYEASLSSDTPNQIRVTITRTVKNSIIQMLGALLTTPVSTSATAAIVSVQSPTPIIVTDPWNQDTLTAGGSTYIKVCGGPSRSIQVNSSNAKAFEGATLDLSQAGPADPGDCTSGTGADLGVFGGIPGPTAPSGVSLGSTGHYVQPASPIQDPFANVPAPAVPTTLGTHANIANGVHGCTDSGGCVEYKPGLYTSGLAPGNNSVIFDPGLYYVQGTSDISFTHTKGGGVNYNAMCVGCAADPDTGTGMVIYNTGPAGSTVNHNPAGAFSWGTQAHLAFQGASLTTTNLQGQVVPTAPYYGILFFEDRTADANSHQFGQGNGCFSVVGTVYITNTADIMKNDSTHTHYQSVSYQGTPCSNTYNRGDIVVGQLHLGGNAAIMMNLVPYGFMNIRQVALVGGGPHP